MIFNRIYVRIKLENNFDISDIPHIESNSCATTAVATNKLNNFLSATSKFSQTNELNLSLSSALYFK